MSSGHRVERLENRWLLSAGQLDTSFGTSGIASVDFDQGNDRLVDVIKLNSDKLLAIGFNDGTFVQMSRLNANGTIDNTFSSDGKIVTSHRWGVDSQSRPGRTAFHSSSGRYAIAVDSPGTSWFDVAVFNSDGSPYTNFDTDGVLTGSTAFQPQRIAFTSQGKMIIAGVAPVLNPSQPPVLIRRYNTDGTQDMTFGEANGQTQLASLAELTNDLIVMSDGRIVLAAEYSYNGTVNDNWDLRYGQELIRLTSAGKFDTAFAGDGILTFNERFDGPSSQAPHGRDMEVASDNSVYVLNDVAGSVALEHITSSGAPDLAFNRLLERPPEAVLTPIRIRLDSAGKILAMGNTVLASATDVPHQSYVARYFADGGLDTSYGARGATVTNVGDATALVVQGEKAVVGGRGNAGTAGTQRDLLLARLQSGAGADPSVVLNARGSLIVHTNNIGEEVSLYIRSRDGRLIVRVDEFAKSFAPSRVKRIALFTLGGDDIVTIHAGVKGSYAEAGGGADSMHGGQFGDVFLGGPGKDRIYGNDGNDILLGNGSNDYLLGGAGKDDLFGEGGVDTLSGAGGNDRLFGGDLADVISGGAGTDAAQQSEEDDFSSVERFIA